MIEQPAAYPIRKKQHFEFKKQGVQAIRRFLMVSHRFFVHALRALFEQFMPKSVPQSAIYLIQKRLSRKQPMIVFCNLTGYVLRIGNA